MGTRGVWACLILALAAQSACSLGFDAPFSGGDRANLDRAAAQDLEKADKKFEDRKFEPAAADYEVFARKYPKSPAAPYAVFQKGRCLQYLEQQDEAIRTFEEILDYYPEVVAYAAPALYFIGASQIAYRDAPKALTVWTELVSDSDYRKHPIAASALNGMASQLMQLGKAAEALRLYRQSAVEFRSLNKRAAYEAVSVLVEHYCINAPNEGELRKLYKDAGGFEQEPKCVAPDADVTQDRAYWQAIWERVQAKARTYPVVQNELKRDLLAYWAEAFKGRFPDWKEYQDQLAAFTSEAGRLSKIVQ